MWSRVWSFFSFSTSTTTSTSIAILLRDGGIEVSCKGSQWVLPCERASSRLGSAAEEGEVEDMDGKTDVRNEGEMEITSKKR